ncbi:MAG: hypothetical protein ACI80I_002330 [Akkermansiaceae bacterium]|jgi:hypothetical protein
MTNQTPRLSLPYIAPAQAQKHVTHNEAIRQLDQIVQLVLVSIDALVPPIGPEVGDVHALGGTTSGDWAGEGGALAIRQVDGWGFVTPARGWLACLRDTSDLVCFGSNGWEQLANGTNNLAGLGIGTTWDVTNLLSVASDASLFNHAGAGHQIKLNKADISETASLLFQSDFTGHAEIGLAGESALSVKVSADGASWYQALRIDPDAEQITFAPADTMRAMLDETELRVDVPLTGTAVQDTALDDRPDRLLKAGSFGLGATDSADVRLSDGQLNLPSGFYSGGGGRADVLTFPDNGARYAPFLNLTRRVTSNDYTQTRLFFSDQAVTVMEKTTLASDWGEQHSLVSRQTLLGNVSQTDGVPTGAVIERGTNTNGTYVRWADGTQICTNADAPLTIDPATFVGTATSIDGDKLRFGRWF